VTTSEPDIRSGKGPYELFMLALCVIALALLAAQAAFPLDPEVRALFGYIDAAICVGFLIDFGINFARAENKLRFMKWGWIDLISSIPTFDPLRWGRAFRIARALRLLRGVKAARMLSTALLERRAESTSWPSRSSPCCWSSSAASRSSSSSASRAATSRARRTRCGGRRPPSRRSAMATGSR